MTTRLAEPTLRLTALAGWVGPHRWPFGTGPATLHHVTLSAADDTVQGVADCGIELARDDQWWRVTPAALAMATNDQGTWRYCGGCLYWAGGVPG